MARFRALIVTLIIFTAVFSASITVTVAGAEHPSTLIMLKDGDLWAWSPSASDLDRLTDRGYVRRPMLSPDSRYVAYNAWADASIEAVRSGLYAPQGDFPSDIWLLDMHTRQSTAITAQLPTISFAGDVPTDAVSRSNPTWSPDGQALAWTEISLPDLGYRLVIYSLAARQVQATVPLSAPLQPDGLRTIRVQWGAGGIALTITRRDSGIVRELYLFEPSGALRLIVPLQDVLYDYLWVDEAGRSYVGLMYATQPWLLVDPHTGQTQPMNGMPEVYSGQTDRYAAFLSIIGSYGSIAGFKWSAVDVPGNRVAPIDFAAETNFAHRIAVSAIGVAYVSDAVYVWKDGAASRIAGTEGIALGYEDPEAGALAWGNSGWRLRRGSP